MAIKRQVLSEAPRYFGFFDELFARAECTLDVEPACEFFFAPAADEVCVASRFDELLFFLAGGSSASWALLFLLVLCGFRSAAVMVVRWRPRVCRTETGSATRSRFPAATLVPDEMLFHRRS